MKIEIRAAALVGTVCAACLATAHAAGDDASPHALAGNLSFATNYVARGLSQTDYGPAMQGTLDYTHASGFYAGVFGSNVSWLADAWEPAAPNVSSNVYGGVVADVISKSLEIDLYGGWRKTFLEDFTFDVGAITYLFPGRYVLDTATYPDLSNPRTSEVYTGLSWRWITAKVWYAVSDAVFMVGDARGTYYANLSASVPLGDTGVTLYGGVGTWEWRGNARFVRNLGIDNGNSVYTFQDVKIGASKELLGFNFGVFWTATNAPATAAVGTNAEGKVAVWANRFGRNIGESSLWASVSKSF